MEYSNAYKDNFALWVETGKGRSLCTGIISASVLFT